jgi:hypothetical protein
MQDVSIQDIRISLRDLQQIISIPGSTHNERDTREILRKINFIYKKMDLIESHLSDILLGLKFKNIEDQSAIHEAICILRGI